MNRRKFLSQGTMAATGITLGIAGFGKKSFASPNETINMGVIGTGSRGRGLMTILQDVPEINVIAGCDVLPFRLEQAMKVADNGAKGYEDYRRVLDNKDIDAVLISTPLSMHSQMAIDALDAGKHVYCEKTMAYSPEQALEMVQKVENSDKIFQVGHQYHSSRLYSKVVDIINDGYIGKVMGFECQWNRNGDWRRSVPDPKFERLINWRMYREYSKGLLAELSSHQIDFANWVTKSHPLSVTGMGGIDYWKDGRETYDNIHAIFEYPDGVKATYTCLTYNSYKDYEIKVFGDEATLFIDYMDAKATLEPKKKKELGIVDGVSGATLQQFMEGDYIPIKAEHMDPSKQALIDFAHSIKDNKQPISNVKTGAKAAFAVSMALEAMQTQQKIHWKDDYNV
ncbi:MAG: Gfo/Idh/MocA family protein [Candidatus Cyclobacteriaceae bacterium M3_2C_046]